VCRLAKFRADRPFFDFSKFEILTAIAVVRPICIISSNFALISQTVAMIWPFVYVSRMRPSAISDLLYASLDHPRRVFAGLCHSAKFDLNHCSSFDNMQVLIFSVKLKMPIHVPFWGVFGVNVGKIENF